jgi:transposase
MEGMLMKLYAGLDVSQATTAICIIRENGERVWEGSSMTEPSAIAEALTKYAPLLERGVLESGQLSTWLTRGLRGLGVPIICVDARQAHKALSAA